MQEYSDFIEQIVAAMKPLIGSIETSEVRKYGLEAASVVYDRLIPHWNTGGGSGMPNPQVTPKEVAVAETFTKACHKLQLTVEHEVNMMHKAG